MRYEFSNLINGANQATDTSGHNRHAQLEHALSRSSGILGRSLYLAEEGTLSLAEASLSAISAFTFAAFVYDEGGDEAGCLAELANTRSGAYVALLTPPRNSPGGLIYALVQPGEESTFRAGGDASDVESSLRRRAGKEVLRLEAPPGVSSRRGKWKHVAVVQSAHSAAFFVNGVEVARKDGPWIFPGALGIDRFTLGNSAMVSHRAFRGGFDQVQLFDRELTAAEIRSLSRLFTVQGRAIYRGNMPWRFKGVDLSCLGAPTEFLSKSRRLGVDGARNNWIESVNAKANGVSLPDPYPGPEVTLDRIQDWCVDSVRFFVAEIGLAGGVTDNGVAIDKAQYAQDVKDAVNKCLSRGLSVVIAMDRLQMGERPAPVKMPMRDTLVAWQALAGEFANDPLVIFEFFNEPNVIGPGSPPFLSIRWRHWAEGGVAAGGGVYYGMQQMVDIFRATRSRGFDAHNLIFVDGIEFAKTLEDVRVLKDPAGALAYAFHPYSTEAWMTVEQWQKDWTRRFLNPSRSHNIPVVVTEWFTRPDLKFDIWNSFTPQRIVALLQFLKDNEIGFYPFTFDILGWLTVNFTDRPTSIYGPSGVLPPAGRGMQFGIGKAVFYYNTRGVTSDDRQAVKVPTVKDL